MANGMKDLVARLRLDTTGFTKGLRGVQGNLKKIGAAMTAASTGMALAIRQQLNTADEMSKASQRLGVPIETLSKLRHAADMSGVSFEQLSVGLKTMSRNMAEAMGGNKTAMKIFEDLGISVVDAEGRMRSTEAVMQDVAEQLSKMPDGAQKTALAMKLFGESGAALLPMLNGGASGLEAMMKEAESLGIVFDKRTGKAAEQFNDNLSRISKTMQGLIVQFAAALAPTLERISAKLVDLTMWFRDLSPATQELAAKLGVIAMAAGPVILGIGMMIGPLQSVIAAMKALTVVALANPFTAIATVLAAAAVAIYLNWEPISALFSSLWQGIKDKATEAWESVTEKAKAAVAGVTGAWTGIREYFGLVLINIKGAFIDGWEAIKAEVGTWPARFIQFGYDIVEGLKQGILERWDAMVASITGKGEELMRKFKGLFGIASPSKVFRGYGQNITEGLALGIVDNGPMVDAAMAGLGDQVGGGVGRIGAAADQMRSAFEGAFTSIVTGASSAKDALRNLAQQLAQMLAQKAFAGIWDAVIGAIGFAKGGVFQGGRVAAFAKGGVVAGATAFAMQGGLGVMGEAGPEAIMPLSRGADGKLGVKAQGGGGVVHVLVEMDSSGNLSPVIRQVAGNVVAQAIVQYDREALPRRLQQINRNPRKMG